MHLYHYNQLIRTHIPWVCLSLIVLIQLYLQYFGLSPWRGGGYGMYSTLHPNRRIIAVEYEGKAEQLQWKHLISISDCQDQARLDSIQRFPKNLSDFKTCLKLPFRTSNLKIYEPSFDLYTGIYKLHESSSY